MSLEIFEGEPRFVQGRADNLLRGAQRIQITEQFASATYEFDGIESAFFRQIRNPLREALAKLRLLVPVLERASEALGTYAGVLDREKELSKSLKRAHDLATEQLAASRQRVTSLERQVHVNQEDSAKPQLNAAYLEVQTHESEIRLAEQQYEEARQRLKAAARVAAHAFKKLPKSNPLRDPPGEGARRRDLEKQLSREQMWADAAGRIDKLPGWLDYTGAGLAGKALASTIVATGGSKASQRVDALGGETDGQRWVDQYHHAAMYTAMAVVSAAIPGAGKGLKIVGRRVFGRVAARTAARKMATNVARKRVVAASLRAAAKAQSRARMYVNITRFEMSQIMARTGMHRAAAFLVDGGYAITGRLARTPGPLRRAVGANNARVIWTPARKAADWLDGRYLATFTPPIKPSGMITVSTANGVRGRLVEGARHDALSSLQRRQLARLASADPDRMAVHLADLGLKRIASPAIAVVKGIKAAPATFLVQIRDNVLDRTVGQHQREIITHQTPLRDALPDPLAPLKDRLPTLADVNERLTPDAIRRYERWNPTPGAVQKAPSSLANQLFPSR